MSLQASLWALIPVAYPILRWLLRRVFGGTSRPSGPFGWFLNLGRFFVKRRTRAEWARRHGLKQYAASVVSATSKLPGVHLTGKLDVDSSYTPLQLRVSGLPDESYLTHKGTVLILGDAGSGKTSLAQMLVRRAAKDCLRRTRRADGRLALTVPLKSLPLAELTRYSRLETWKFLVDYFHREHLSPLNLYDCEDLLDQVAATSGWMIVLDGLDEVRSDLRPAAEHFIRHIGSLAHSQPGPNLLIVTSRRQALNRLDSSLVEVFDDIEALGAFSISGIFSYLLRYPYRSGSAAENASRILEHLRLYPQLLEACRSPLVLSMFVGLDQRRANNGDLGYGFDLPDTRSAFFKTVADELLIRRNQVPGQSSNALRALREEFLQQLAVSHLDDPEESYNRISEQRILAQLTRANLVPDGRLPSEALEEFATQTGVLARSGDDTWEFVHRSFLDYFAGRSYSTLHYGRRSDFVRRVARSPDRFEEAMFFACGLIASFGRTQATAWLRDIRRLHPGAYARACLEAQTYKADDFVPEMQAQISRLEAKSEPSTVALLDRVLLDYCRVCGEVGQTAQISRATLLRKIDSAFSSRQEAVQFLVSCDISMVGDLPEVLSADLSSLSYEEIIRVCYEPEALAFVSANVLTYEPTRFPWPSILAEAALRSSLVSTQLRRDVLQPSAVPTSGHWLRAWPIRSTFFGYVLDVALADTTASIDAFPHLAVLKGVRQPSRSRLGDSARSLLSSPYAMFLVAYSALLTAIAAVSITSYQSTGFAPTVVMSLLAVAYIAMLVRRRTAFLRPSLPRLLNLDPVDFPRALAEHIVVRRSAKVPRRLMIARRASLENGPLSAPDQGKAYVFDQVLPFVWLTYSPSGRGRLRQVAAARIQQWDMEVLRELARSADE